MGLTYSHSRPQESENKEIESLFTREEEKPLHKKFIQHKGKPSSLEDVLVLVPLKDASNISPTQSQSVIAKVLAKDTLKHILMFLNQKELALSCAWVSKSWKSEAMSPILPQWRGISMVSVWNRVDDRLLELFAFRAVQFSRLQRLWLDDCVELTEHVFRIIAGASFRNSVQDVSLCGCKGIRLDRKSCKEAIKYMVRSCESLKKLELFGTGFKNLTSAFQVIDIVKSLKSDVNLGKFEIYHRYSELRRLNEPIFDQSCHFLSVEGSGPCQGLVFPNALYSNQQERSMINAIHSIIYCCDRHRNEKLSQSRCSFCGLHFFNSNPRSLLSSANLENALCTVCYDRMILRRKSSWVDLSQFNPNPKQMDDFVQNHVIALGSKKHLFPTLKFIGSGSSDGELRELLAFCKSKNYSRALLAVPFLSDEEKANGMDVPTEVFSDEGLITDAALGGEKNLSLVQLAWRHSYHILWSIFSSVIFVAFFMYVSSDLSVQPNFSASTPNFGASLKESQQQTTSLGFLILVGSSLLVSAIAVFICWWRFRLQWERIFSLILGIDFMMILGLGGTVLSFIFAQWSEMRTDFLTFTLCILNFSIVGAIMLYIRGNFLEYFSSLEKLQQKSLVLMNAVMAAMVALTLSKYLVIGLLILPVLHELIESWRRFMLFRAGVPLQPQSGFIFLSGTTERSDNTPIIIYEIPNTSLRIRSADLLWLGLLVSLAEISFVGSVAIVMGSILITVFVLPYVQINSIYPHITIAFILVLIYTSMESYLIEMMNNLATRHVI
jgi:hypothetical protein